MRFVRVETPIGRLTLVGGEEGLREVLWPDEPPPASAEEGANPVLAAAAEQLGEYFAGTRTTFEVPLDLVGTEFQRQAWLALAEVPYGTTVTYTDQARRIGRPRAVRAVGSANASKPVPIVLPCHRVVGANGSLTGFGGGLGTKRALLDHEARVARRLAPRAST